MRGRTRPPTAALRAEGYRARTTSNRLARRGRGDLDWGESEQGSASAATPLFGGTGPSGNWVRKWVCFRPCALQLIRLFYHITLHHSPLAR
jgi:hypothetical protein